MTMATDESWAEVARKSRNALAMLGYDIGPQCLPDEPEPCGGSFAMHATAHLATLKAVADHQLAHLGPPFISASGEIYLDKRAELDITCLRDHDKRE